mmetsp:Transcript_17404/g.54622  ORF Transcript_17404/g.54622 Transcript_17404/m.54622 type:complete len:245 (-) Transcript_17404:115-849(-)
MRVWPRSSSPPTRTAPRPSSVQWLARARADPPSGHGSASRGPRTSAPTSATSTASRSTAWWCGCCADWRRAATSWLGRLRAWRPCWRASAASLRGRTATAPACRLAAASAARRLPCASLASLHSLGSRKASERGGRPPRLPMRVFLRPVRSVPRAGLRDTPLRKGRRCARAVRPSACLPRQPLTAPRSARDGAASRRAGVGRWQHGAGGCGPGPARFGCLPAAVGAGSAALCCDGLSELAPTAS